MFDRGGNNLISTLLGFECREDCGVIGFAATGCENDLLVEGGSNQRLNLAACNLYRLGHCCAQGML